jgi:hypothetical protein
MMSRKHLRRVSQAARPKSYSAQATSDPPPRWYSQRQIWLLVGGVMVQVGGSDRYTSDEVYRETKAAPQ